MSYSYESYVFSDNAGKELILRQMFHQVGAMQAEISRLNSEIEQLKAPNNVPQMLQRLNYMNPIRVT